ncbi:hypothetical protein Scep_030264 [Stephania cephalantha]|uniref:Uncharacterized protein n=1 Tax=Stephania cephalantha TaxID=152367 RepID=A0AAP0E2J3_9MAGN
MATDVVNFLSGRSFGPTTTTTTTATGTTDTSAPPKQPLDSPSTIALLHIPPQVMHHPQRSMLAPQRECMARSTNERI